MIGFYLLFVLGGCCGDMFACLLNFRLLHYVASPNPVRIPGVILPSQWVVPEWLATGMHYLASLAEGVLLAWEMDNWFQRALMRFHPGCVLL